MQAVEVGAHAYRAAPMMFEDEIPKVMRDPLRTGHNIIKAGFGIRPGLKHLTHSAGAQLVPRWRACGHNTNLLPCRAGVSMPGTLRYMFAELSICNLHATNGPFAPVTAEAFATRSACISRLLCGRYGIRQEEME